MKNKKKIQFFILYEESKSERELKNEEIIFYLNLYGDDGINK